MVAFFIECNIIYGTRIEMTVIIVELPEIAEKKIMQPNKSTYQSWASENQFHHTKMSYDTKKGDTWNVISRTSPTPSKIQETP